MKNILLKVVSILCLTVFCTASIQTVRGAGGAEAKPGVEISKEDAAKKFPDQKGHYAEGIATSTSTGGFFQSPYSSRVYDCRKMKKGSLVVDEPAKKAFLRP
jgi:hypothetical protein